VRIRFNKAVKRASHRRNAERRCKWSEEELADGERMRRRRGRARDHGRLLSDFLGRRPDSSDGPPKCEVQCENPFGGESNSTDTEGRAGE
jgi:hypothetical protein